ncbi:hypothetical protein ES703_36324 [subsurface metagenome]
MAKKLDVDRAFEGRQLPKKFSEFKDDTETRIVHIRLHKQRVAALITIFKAQGKDMSTGIRSVLYEWLSGQLR